MGDLTILSEYTDADINPNGRVIIVKGTDVIIELTGSVGSPTLGRFIWAGHLLSPQETLIAISYKSEITDTVARIKLYKHITDSAGV